jgi:hypothetical protein
VRIQQQVALYTGTHVCFLQLLSSCDAGPWSDCASHVWPCALTTTMACVARPVYRAGHMYVYVQQVAGQQLHLWPVPLIAVTGAHLTWCQHLRDGAVLQNFCWQCLLEQQSLTAAMAI